MHQPMVAPARRRVCGCGKFGTCGGLPVPSPVFAQCAVMNKPLRHNMKKLTLCFALTAAVLTMVGCKHTANGMGKDIEKAGEKIQEKTQ
jgi:predicted small secreted protein